MKKQILLGLSLSVLAGSALAQTGLYVTGDLAYGGMKTGSKATSFGLVSQEKASVAKSKDVYSNPNGRVGLGYLFGEGPLTFGGEVAYIKYDTNKYQANQNGTFNINVNGTDIKNFEGKASTDVNFKRQDLELLGVVNYDVNRQLNVFSKFGFAVANQKVTASESAVGKNGDTDVNYSSSLPAVKTDEFAPKLAVGLGYNFSRELTGTVSYAHTFGKSLSPETTKSYNDLSSTNLFNVGLSYHFA